MTELGEAIANPTPELTNVLLSDGKQYIVFLGNREIHLIDVSTISIVSSLSFDATVQCATFSEDKQSLAVCCGQTATLYSIPSLKVIASPQLFFHPTAVAVDSSSSGHDIFLVGGPGVYHVAVRADGAMAASLLGPQIDTFIAVKVVSSAALVASRIDSVLFYYPRPLPRSGPTPLGGRPSFDQRSEVGLPTDLAVDPEGATMVCWDGAVARSPLPEGPMEWIEPPHTAVDDRLPPPCLLSVTGDGELVVSHRSVLRLPGPREVSMPGHVLGMCRCGSLFVFTREGGLMRVEEVG
ncbi:hypothetical protein J8273_3138 [Carpediemonas membranifera]|uniref:Uncharacterized protein n=1 Tax=Carpediemonas membranifera TaxID=201153 RepID=A0A8J6EAW5_9EUKA|nr:hypothetical protein J8273_3138 [Carpediemonas membranifera]|eukprot:KAG9395560.1 hypothetical protein J8273_3138 [Carpediemonas membranifera]